nr:hypothetical protein CFP56_02099 [Quercus suber]
MVDWGGAVVCGSVSGGWKVLGLCGGCIVDGGSVGGGVVDGLVGGDWKVLVHRWVVVLLMSEVSPEITPFVTNSASKTKTHPKLFLRWERRPPFYAKGSDTHLYELLKNPPLTL